MAYSPSDVEAAGRRLAELLQRQEQRLNAMEQKPAQDEFAQQWDAGREYARAKGYTGEYLNDLEEQMQRNTIASHEHAIRLGLAPSNPHPILGMLGVPANEIGDMFHNTERWTDSAIAKVRRGE